MTVTVTINTINERWENISREVAAWLKQADQVLISTVDDDPNIERLRVEYPSAEIVTMPRADHPGHCPRGSFLQLNNSLPHVRSKWWCFASGNDRVYPFKAQLERDIAERTDAIAVYSDIDTCNDSGTRTGRIRLRKYDPKAHERQNVLPDCSLIRTDILREFNGFRTELNNYAFWDLWLRVRAKYGNTRFIHNDRPTWAYRQGADDMHVKRSKSPEQKMQANRDRNRMLAMHGIGSHANVVSFCMEDHANFMYENARALKAVGINVRAMKMKAHPYGYPEQAEIVPLAKVREAIRHADVVQVFFNTRAFDLIRPWCKGKRIFMYYAGTEFRVNASAYLRQMNPIVERSVIALSEFAGMGAKNESYLSVTVDTDAIQMQPWSGGRVVGHYPSSATVKGTDTIRKALDGMPDIDIDTELVPYADSLRRMQRCDIYVELFAPTNNGKPYGSFGTTAVEAAAMGKVVITQNLHADVYLQAYGDCPLILVTEPEQIRAEVERLRAMPEKEFAKLREVSRKWAEDKHSYIATGKRLMEWI